MKIIKIVTIGLLIIFILSQNIFAVAEIFNTAKDWTNTGKEHSNMAMDTSVLQKSSNKLYNLLLAFGVAIAIIVGVILGLQFMTAGVDKKVQVKESLFPYLISCIVLFGAFGIWKFMLLILKDF